MRAINGTTDQCLRHLESVIEKQSDFYNIREQFARIVGVSSQSVYRWAKEKKVPTGEALIRLRYYLEHLGYCVTELESLKPRTRTLGRLFAFRVVTLDEIVDTLEFDGDRQNISDMVIALFRGPRGTTEDRVRSMDQLTVVHEGKLPKLLTTVPKVVTLNPANSTSREEAPVAHRDILPRNISQSAWVVPLAQMIKGMVPLAEMALSDGCTAVDRENVRALAGAENVSRLSNLLTQLCSEATRNVLKSN